MILPWPNNVSVKIAAAMNPHEPKSCEARFWFVAINDDDDRGSSVDSGVGGSGDGGGSGNDEL